MIGMNGPACLTAEYIDFAKGVSIMNRYLIITAITALVLAIAADSFCDHLQFHFGQGITSGLDHDSYWYPDGSRKYDDNGQRKTVFNWRTGWRPVDMMLRIPAFVYDGWHLIKVFRWFFLATVAWAWGLYWYEPKNAWHWIEVAFVYLWFLVAFGLFVWVLHPFFFEWLYEL